MENKKLFSLAAALLLSLNVHAVGLSDFVKDAKAVQDKINSGSFSPVAVQILTAHKVMIDNLIALKMLVKNCDDLRELDTSLTDGWYTLYPGGNKNNPMVVKCDVRGTQAFNVTQVRPEIKQACSQSGACRAPAAESQALVLSPKVDFRHKSGTGSAKESWAIRKEDKGEFLAGELPSLTQGDYILAVKFKARGSSSDSATAMSLTLKDSKKDKILGTQVLGLDDLGTGAETKSIALAFSNKGHGSNPLRLGLASAGKIPITIESITVIKSVPGSSTPAKTVKSAPVSKPAPVTKPKVKTGFLRRQPR